MKKVFLLLLFFPLIQLACDKEYGSCDSAKYFNITGLELTLFYTDEKNQSKKVEDFDSVRFETFSFYANLKAEYYSFEAVRTFSFFPKAIATTPCLPMGWDGSEEKLAGFYLISIGKYNANIQPGDTLQDVYRIGNQTPAEYISMNTQKIRDQQLQIHFTEKPDPTEYQSFKLVYKLTNGETYEAITPRFKLY